MRLYKMELYKICSKKLFLFSALASLVILLLYFHSFVTGADSTINGVQYRGYQAVRMDRAITEEFKGELTDEKVTQIIDKYGFPSGVSENCNVFLDRNYLNDFVMREFSDGYFRGWDDYHVGTCTYPIAETELGKAGAATGKMLILEYSYGWKVFTEVLELGCMLGMVLILLAISPVFSEEGYMNTQQILFTTKEGKAKDIAAKIAAGMTVVIAVCAIVIILDLILVGVVFGLDGRNCLYSQVMEEFVREWNHYNNTSTRYMEDFIRLAVATCFLGMIEAAAISLYFSAHCNSPFHSVITSALCLVMPMILNILGRGDFSGILFIMSQMFDIFLLGIAVMCLVPDIPNKAVLFGAKVLCCVLPLSAGLCFRRIFPFYYTIPGVLVMFGVADLDIFVLRYPWIREQVFLFAFVASVIFIVCSWKKYRG